MPCAGTLKSMNMIPIRTISSIIIFSFTATSFLTPNSSIHDVAFNSITFSQNDKILGSWLLENDTLVRFEFLADQKLNTYHGNTLIASETWQLTRHCEGEVGSDAEHFLKIVDEQGFVDCNIITNLDHSNTGHLAFISSSGRIVVLVRRKI